MPITPMVLYSTSSRGESRDLDGKASIGFYTYLDSHFRGNDFNICLVDLQQMTVIHHSFSRVTLFPIHRERSLTSFKCQENVFGFVIWVAHDQRINPYRFWITSKMTTRWLTHFKGNNYCSTLG